MSSGGGGLLIDATKDFVREWSRLHQSWNDRNAEAFEAKYITPIDGQVRRACEAMDRLAETAAAARRACE